MKHQEIFFVLCFFSVNINNGVNNYEYFQYCRIE